MRRLVMLLALLAGCRNCEDRGAGTQPPMPPGMLVPSEGGATTKPAPPMVVRLRVSMEPTEGWFRVASPKATRWLSVAAFALMENAFARAEPGFGPFGKRVVTAEHAPALATELRSLRTEWTAMETLDAARAKFPDALRDVDGAWPEMREAYAKTLEDIAELASLGAEVTVSTP